MNRALRAAIVGVALFSPVALSACSAGQVAQTATQVRDKTGAMAEVGDISLRQVQLVYPRSGSYDAGDDAELTMSIVNTGREADTLVSIDGEGFGSVEINGTSPGAADGSTSAAPTSVASSPTIALPPNGTVFVGSDDLTVTLTDLDEALTVGQYVTVVLTFEQAGETTLRARVANPSSAQDRGESFDFHQEEGSGESE